MELRDLEIATEFCALVQTADLLEYLALPRSASADDAVAALAERRRRLQGMQNNPKYKDSARYLLKHYQALSRVAASPEAHLEHARVARERELIPTLQMAIDSALADGVITKAEEAFVRRAALALGISEATYERVLAERAARAGVAAPLPETSGPPTWSGGRTTAPARPGRTSTEPDVQGASEHNWWDAGFTHLLLQVIPGGPGQLVDVYCRGGTSALTLLPQRPQLGWLGLERNPRRFTSGQGAIAPYGDRAKLLAGTPEQIPLPDESVDYVLGVRALAYLSDSRPVFEEARRVLRAGGRALFAEPDGLAESFYFDGHLEGYNAAFHALGLRIDARMRGDASSAYGPGLALGPQLARRVREVGLTPIRTLTHASSTLEDRPFARLSRHLRRYPRALAQAAGLPEDDPAISAVDAEVDRLDAEIPGDRVALCGHVMAMFLVAAVKEG